MRESQEVTKRLKEKKERREEEGGREGRATPYMPVQARPKIMDMISRSESGVPEASITVLVGMFFFV
jgi:hypothetical protein